MEQNGGGSDEVEQNGGGSDEIEIEQKEERTVNTTNEGKRHKQC